MVFIDTHIHLDAPQWKSPVSTRIQQLKEYGVSGLLQPGVGAAQWSNLLSLARNYSGVYVAPGLHPMHAADWSPGLLSRLRELTRQPEVVAIGEVGLDGLLDVDETLQMTAFQAQLHLAVEAGLPVLIHCRKQTATVLNCLQQAGISQVGGVWHGFSGSLETAAQVIAQGLLIGVGPVLLRENARKLPGVVKSVPAESLVLETDAPDMATGPKVLIDVAKKMAELRNWSLEETAAITTANARRLLKLQDTKERE